MKSIFSSSSNGPGLIMIDTVHNTANANLLCVSMWVCEHM